VGGMQEEKSIKEEFGKYPQEYCTNSCTFAHYYEMILKQEI
jgi:hypothetical protein